MSRQLWSAKIAENGIGRRTGLADAGGRSCRLSVLQRWPSEVAVDTASRVVVVGEMICGMGMPWSGESSVPEDRGPLLERRVLDRQAARSRRDDPAPWGVWPWLGPVLVIVAVIVAGQLLRPHIPVAGGGHLVAAFAYTVAAEVVVVASVWASARGPALRAGGWRALLGLDVPRGGDLVPVLFGVVATFAARIAVGVVAVALAGAQAVAQSQNLQLTRPSHVDVSLLIIAAVLMAPVVEETVFRGLLLRAFMRRLRFWPSALLSSAIFALFHTYEVATVVGALTLAAGVAALGIGNCYLVRITGRLAPGMAVHAAFNFLAVILAVHRATQ